MAGRLRQVVSSGVIAAGASAVVAHSLNVAGRAAVPDYAFLDVSSFDVTAATSSTVTIVNNSPSAASCNVLLWVDHTVDRELGGAIQNLSPRPFVVRGAAAAAVVGTYQTALATDTQTTASAVPVPMPNMTLTVAAAGTYLCLFNAVNHSNSATGAVTVAFYQNGGVVSGSHRHLEANRDQVMTIIQPVTLAAGDTIAVYWSVDANNATVHDRNLTIVRLA